VQPAFPQQAASFGAPSPQAAAAPGIPAADPHAGVVASQPGGFEVHSDAQAQQSNVETKMSMPRPAAVSQWIAEQGTLENPGPRSTPVLMAIALLSTLCVIGVGALVAYKIRVGDQPVGANASALPSSTHEPLAPESAGGSKPDGTERATSTAGGSGTSKPSSSSASTSTSSPSKSGTSSPGKGPAPADKGDDSDPGFLTVFCNPACDSIIAGGRSLGASPVVNASLPPGQHRVTLKRSGGPTKVISVIIVSGQVTSQRVSMK
jgi:serine/threonine-protein kinase